MGFSQIDAHEEEISSTQDQKYLADNDGSTRELTQKKDELAKMNV
jgi:hypothetical protein